MSSEYGRPLISGRFYYVQAFELSAAAPQGLFASNGLSVLFAR